MRPFVSANAAAAAAAAGAVPHSASAGAVAAQYECRCECRCECRLAAIAAGSYWQRLATIGAGLGPSALLSRAKIDKPRHGGGGDDDDGSPTWS